MAIEDSPPRRASFDTGSELFARKGRANARGFGTGTVDAVAAEVARAAQPRSAIDLGPSIPETAAPDPGTRYRALIADGDPLSRKLYRDILEAEGYDVALATDGAEALEAVRNQAPSIAVVNLRLADFSGLEVVRRINDDDDVGAFPVLAVAERFQSADEADSRAEGCAAYLAKPISVRKFVDTIDQLVQESAATDRA